MCVLENIKKVLKNTNFPRKEHFLVRKERKLVKAGEMVEQFKSPTHFIFRNPLFVENVSLHVFEAALGTSASSLLLLLRDSGWSKGTLEAGRHPYFFLLKAVSVSLMSLLNNRTKQGLNFVVRCHNYKDI